MAVLSAVGGVEGESEIEDLRCPLPEPDVNRLSDMGGQSWFRGPAVLPADLVYKGRFARKILLDLVTRRGSQGDIAGVDV